MGTQSHRLKATLALFVVLVSWPASFPASRKVMIAFVKVEQGSVKLQRKHQAAIKITGTVFLQESDIITIDGEGSAYLYQVYARIENLKPNETKTIIKLPPSHGQEILDADQFARLAALIAAARQHRLQRSPGRMGGPDDLVVTALAPKQSLVIDARPTFEWTPVPGATTYDVAVYDAKQSRRFWQITTKEPRATYPDPSANDSIKPLQPGEYIWQVKAEVDANHKALAAARFFIATPTQAQAARAALAKAGRFAPQAATNLFYIQAAFVHRLYPLAERDLKQALRRTPDDEVLWALLMQAYENMQRYEDRNRIFDYLKDPKAADLEKILGTAGVLPQR